MLGNFLHFRKLNIIILFHQFYVKQLQGDHLCFGNPRIKEINTYIFYDNIASKSTLR
jgi:hypothetical protein